MKTPCMMAKVQTLVDNAPSAKPVPSIKEAAIIGDTTPNRSINRPKMKLPTANPIIVAV